MISEARKALEKIGVTNINPALPARHYDMQERKLIEIAKFMREKTHEHRNNVKDKSILFKEGIR